MFNINTPKYLCEFIYGKLIYTCTVIRTHWWMLKPESTFILIANIFQSSNANNNQLEWISNEKNSKKVLPPSLSWTVIPNGIAFRWNPILSTVVRLGLQLIGTIKCSPWSIHFSWQLDNYLSAVAGFWNSQSFCN